LVVIVLKSIFPTHKSRRHNRKWSWSCLCLSGAIASWRQVYVWNTDRYWWRGKSIMAASREIKCSTHFLWRRDPRSAHLWSLDPTQTVLILHEMCERSTERFNERKTSRTLAWF